MADNGVAQAKRAARRAETADQLRNVRMRLDDVETRLGATAARVEHHELRLGYLEASLKIVLRDLNCVQEFLRNKDTDYKLAKGAFIAAFFAELKDTCTAEANWAINEAETLAVEHDGLVLVGIFPTGGHWEGTADAVLRLQSSWVGGRISYLLTAAAPYLGETRQLFTDQVRKPKGKGKGEGQPKGKGKNKGKGGKKGKAAVHPSGQLHPLVPVWRISFLSSVFPSALWALYLYADTYHPSLCSILMFTCSFSVSVLVPSFCGQSPVLPSSLPSSFASLG